MTTLSLSRKNISLLTNLSILSVTCALLPLQVYASDAIAPGDSESKWVLGTSIGALNNPYIGESNETVVGLNIRYNGERFFIKDNSLNLHIAKRKGFSVGLKAVLDYGFLSDKDDYKNNTKLAGLSERDGTVLGGIYANHDTDLGRLSFNALTDLGDKHDGQLVAVKYTFNLNAGKWNINPEFGAEWINADYVNHLAGVSTAEATKSRLQYEGKDTINLFAGIRARYEITNNWDINLETGVAKLGSEISDSSIIDDDMVYGASFGINYNF